MNYSSFIIVILSAFAVAAAGVVYVSLSHRKAMQNRLERREFLSRAEIIQLPKMLKALGIGIGRFFYKAPLHELKDSVVLCENCSAENLCRQKLKIPELNPEDVDFCPNLVHLSKYSRAARIRK